MTSSESQLNPNLFLPCSERGAMQPYADMIRRRAPQLDVRVSARDCDPFAFD